MTWPVSISHLNEVILATFGEPLTLPDGLTPGIGVFDPLGDPGAAPWPDAGLTVRLSAEPAPVLRVTETLAATIAEQLADATLLTSNPFPVLLIRDQPYRVAEIHPADSGLVRLDLAPETRTDDDDPEARWQ